MVLSDYVKGIEVTKSFISSFKPLDKSHFFIYSLNSFRFCMWISGPFGRSLVTENMAFMMYLVLRIHWATLFFLLDLWFRKNKGKLRVAFLLDLSPY